MNAQATLKMLFKYFIRFSYDRKFYIKSQENLSQIFYYNIKNKSYMFLLIEDDDY